MEISLVIPVYNEAGNISELASEISEVFSSTQMIWECIWIDDASEDDTWMEIKKLSKPNKGLKLRTNSGQTTATKVGINAAKFNTIATLDGDGQNNPNDILKMIDILQSNSNIDLVQGYRLHRVDNKYTRKIPSKIANKLVQVLANQSIRDLGCSLRVFKKHLMSNLILTGEMHRLLTLYLLDNGAKIVETSVNHRKRNSGRSKYGFSRIFKLIIDVILYKSLKAIFISPIYTFAKFALIGFVFSVFLFILTILLRVMNFKNYIDGTLISTSIVLFATSSVFIGLGLVAEMVTRVLPQNSRIYPFDASDEHN